ncbi:hypothetical protein ACFL26_00260 [Patescibacteria group bacterium]
MSILGGTKSNLYVWATTSLICVSVLVGRSVFAMSSDNYRIDQDVMSFGGGYATSTGYVAWDTVGEAATGEGLSSASYSACAGFQCALGGDYISFSVTAGTSAPGLTGAGVALGTLTTGSVTGSNNSDINSIFVTVEASNEVEVAVQSSDDGLQSASRPTALIDAYSGLLEAGTEGFGICVTSVTEDAGSPTTLEALSPYNGTCNTGAGHNVGPAETTRHGVMSSSGELVGGEAEILVKAAISTVTGGGITDYAADLTFTATATY